MDEKWTPKGKPRDGWYYEGECTQHGKTQVMAIGNGGASIVCAHENANNNCNAKITETRGY